VLSPSVGFGGGIERVARAVECSLPSVHRLDLYRIGREPIAEGQTLRKLAFAYEALSCAIRSRPATVVCLHAGLLSIAHLTARVGGAHRPVLFAYGTEVWGQQGATRRTTIASCKSVLAISTFTAEEIVRRTAVPRRRVTVLPLPIDEQLAKIAAARIPSLTRAPVIVSVSRLDPAHRYKGHFQIAEAWTVVRQQRPDARWCVVGHGADTDSLRRRCDALGHGDSVTFEQHVTEARLAELYATTAGLVLPSVADPDADPPEGEGFGLVYAEAGAFATPSVASRQGGGALDFVKHEETGLLVPPRDTTALAEAMLRLLDDPPLRARLGLAARAAVSERHLPARFESALRHAVLA
jgi:phosphatidylinositol alpha-1,6-mannosyltransferase